jgi:hypothetical protein
MTAHHVPESDRKVFRELRELALEWFCKRVLEELEPLRRDTSRSHHERYLDVFRFLQARDEEFAHAFNDPRRSRMIIQLAPSPPIVFSSPMNSNVSPRPLAPPSNGSPVSSPVSAPYRQRSVSGWTPTRPRVEAGASPASSGRTQHGTDGPSGRVHRRT